MVRHPDLCGPNADSFDPGECDIGWAYITLIIGTTLGLFAALISWTPAMCVGKNSDGQSYTL